MSIKAVRTLLDTQLQTVQGLPQLQFENTRATTQVERLTRSTLNPATSNVLTIGFKPIMELQGRYQVDNFFPQDVSADEASALADAIVMAFPVGLLLTDGTTQVRISNVSVMTAQGFDKFYNAPVAIQWSAINSTQ